MTVAAQQLKTKSNWHNLDYTQDGVRGMSVERAYEELLKNRKSKTVVVAVIDSGIDILHEDLAEVIWKNPREIPNNGIDDDKNGFIDDIHGWDFIGSKDGRDINQEQLESTRLLVMYKKKFGENPSKRLIKKYKSEYTLLKSLDKEIKEKKDEAMKFLPMYQDLYNNFVNASLTLSQKLGTKDLTTELVEGMNDAEIDREVRQAKQFWLRLSSMGATEADLRDGVKYFEEQVNYAYNFDFSPREIIGDNPSKLEYGGYGNNEVIGPDAMHGTHVAGIIGAVRNNEKGINGVADNVQIMVIRCVPNGDERDKDVANAIRYAADNGASIINMSFGKRFSPEKSWVDEAVKYAESKGVLFIAAAGNDNTDIDKVVHYPTKKYADKGEASQWITVGALNFEEGAQMPAEFSNYGKQGVDVFAPGVAIYSTVPGSKYEEKQGTSMAAPAVTGVAALLKSYFPELTSKEIKSIILNSVTSLADVQVNKPGTNQTVDFGQLSITGGVVNAYNAVKMALQQSK